MLIYCGKGCHRPVVAAAVAAAAEVTLAALEPCKAQGHTAPCRPHLLEKVQPGLSSGQPEKTLLGAL